MLNYSKYLKYSFYNHFLLKNIFLNIHLLNDCKNISIVGWVHSISRLKNKSFLKLHDGRSNEMIQVVLTNNLVHKNFYRGCCIKVSGEVVDSPGEGQIKEVRALSCESLSENHHIFNDQFNLASETLVNSMKTGIKSETARKELLHFRHRYDCYSAIGRIRAFTKQSIRNYMITNEYLEVDPPILTSIDCEGAGEAYKAIIETPNESIIIKPQNLTVSAQLHLEALVLGYGKVYTLGPIFRANKSRTRHHLSEFLMLEVESININSVIDLCNSIEHLIKTLSRDFFNNNADNLELIRKSNLVQSEEFSGLELLSETISDNNFIRISFQQAVEILKESKIISPGLRIEEIEFSKSEEQRLVSLLGNRPVFVTDFPMSQKPFYCRPNEGGETVMAVDLLLPFVGEVVGGSVRDTDYDRLKSRMKHAKLNETDMNWYLDLRGTGSCPHSGFGVGFDRLLQFWTGVYNIQDVVTFPRTFNTCIM